MIAAQQEVHEENHISNLRAMKSLINNWKGPRYALMRKRVLGAIKYRLKFLRRGGMVS